MNITIGLKQGEVSLAEPSREWPLLFGREHRLLAHALGDLARAIEHVGSTAVGALPAKPIIDIAVAVQAGDTVARVIPRLEQAGYVYHGEAAFPGGHLFVRESASGLRTHHVHVVPLDDPQWRSWLRFRDFLKTDRELRRRYTRLKRELKSRFPSDRRSYTLGKTRFIEDALSRES